jgi:type III secretion protein J
MRSIQNRARSVLMVVLLSVGCLGCREELMHNLSEHQANRLMSRLHESAIDSTKQIQPDGRWAVEVEKIDLPVAMRELQRLRLMRDPRISGSETSSMLPSKEQQRFTFERALSAEIEDTLLSIEGVLEARVHLNLPLTDPLFGTQIPGAQGSGSVFIISERKLVLSSEDLALLVAGAAGITVEKVSVLIEHETESRVEDKIGQESVQDKSASPHPVLSGSVAFDTRKGIGVLVGFGLMMAGFYLLRTYQRWRRSVQPLTSS